MAVYGEKMGEIAAAIAVILTWGVVSPCPVTSQSSVQDSGNDNFSTIS
jgi:hypothetical protein